MTFINYNHIIENSLNEVYVFDAESLKFIDVNQCAREHLGYSMEELQEMTPLDIKPEYTKREFCQMIEPLRSGDKEKLIFWTVHRRKNATTYPIEVHLQHETFQGVNVFVALILDITEQKRIENQNIGLNRIFNDSLNEILIFDAVTLKFVEVNRGARQNLGYTLEELRHLTPLDIKPEITPDNFSALLMQLRLDNQKKIEFITVHRRKDGTEYPVEVHLQLSTFMEKPVFVAIILDITERQASQQAMIEFALKSERMHILKQFISDTSHEFRNPMSVLNTKIYLLQKSLTDDPLQQHLAVMQTQINRLEQLISGLHRLSELDAIDGVDFEQVQIAPMIENVCQQLMKTYQHKEHQVEMKITQDVHEIEGDTEKLQLALYHIVKNAFDYTPPGGSIDIQVFIEDEGLNIHVCDTGVGIAKGEVGHIFERLYRIDPSRNIQSGGIGLGLAIAQRIIELHNGNISVRSLPDSGSCFYVTLPLHPSPTHSSSLMSSN